ncbi:MAG: hypothetical protein SPL10_04950 [Synergistales bacterium]|nr:hypothetical protein [Synergistales bacterium]MDY6401139.1 hypothetical protein [Synergistales bacterium]MDY6404732.1 hypothetical protein [Synergistales bacterium]MDY6409938.1 hypothetical protein [Synergistales bacterium]MDY6414490.1 hypothetical protein [Synergistales bacterium]
MARRKKNWKRFRSRLYLLALIAGIVTYMWQYREWFALKGYRIETQSSAIEQRLWEIFPRRCLTFWPYLLKDSQGLKEFMERDMPVTIETHMEGLGRFVTRTEWLKAWVKVEWRGKIWCISRDGRMWLFEKGIGNNEETGNLIWRIPEQKNNENNNAQVPLFGVFKSPLPIEIISSFLADFNSFKWFENASGITFESRAGMNLFILEISNGTQKFELYLQPDKYPGQDVGQTVEDIYERLLREGGNHTIDATYEGKILLRGL